MKKFFTLCLMTLFCCVTGAWAQGTGTQEDPWIANVGEELQLDIPMMGMGYAEFTPEVDGTLTLTRTGGFVTMSGVSLQAKGGGEVIQGVWDFVTTSYKFTPVLKGGTTYVVTFNCSSVMDACTNTFRFDYEEYTVDPNAFRIISASPEAGSKIEKVVCTKPITVTVNRTQEQIGRMEADFTDNSQNVEVKFVSEDLDAGTSTWTVGPVDMSDVWPDYVSEWTLYEGTTYTLTLEIYEEGQSSQGGTPTETCSITYEGATEATKYSDAKMISVSPSPDAFDPETEEMLSMENGMMTVVFSGHVDVTDCCVAQGMWGSIDLPDYTVTYDEANNQTTLVVNVANGISPSDYNVAVNITAVDAETGLALNDEMPSVSGVTFSGGVYSVSMPVADGRTVDYGLEAVGLNPQDNGYVTKIDEVALTLGNGNPADDGALYYTTTPDAKGELFKDGEKVADVVLINNNAFDETSAEYTLALAEIGTVNYDNFENDVRTPLYTPMSVTEPGQYTMVIAKRSIGDGIYDPSSPWLTTQAGTKGRCNPEWTWTFNVVDHIATVESVSPEPYGVTGEYNEEIPAEITVKFSDPARIGFIQYHNVATPMLRQPITEYTYEDNTLTFKLPEDALASRGVTVIIQATADNGQPYTYGYSDEEVASGIYGVQLVYQMPMDIMVPETVTPAEDEKVEALDEITLKFNQNAYYTDTENTLELKDAEGNTVTTATPEVGADDTEIVLLLDPVVTTPGEYTLTIPEKAIYDLDGINYNPELTLTFTVGELSGINGIKVDADGTVKVYTIDGIYVGEGNAADMLGKLAKGVYIVNGTKVVVK